MGFRNTNLLIKQIGKKIQEDTGEKLSTFYLLQSISMATFCFQKFVDNAQQCFAFITQANFPAHNLLKVKVIGLKVNFVQHFIKIITDYSTQQYSYADS